MVTEYVPAGVPPVTAGVLLLEPHPAWNITSAKNALSNNPESRPRFFFLTPSPINASPDIGIHVAYIGHAF